MNRFLTNDSWLRSQLRRVAAAAALGALTLAAMGQAPLTPWATNGTLATSSVPWVVYSTIVSTNGTNSVFPSLCYDWTNNRLLGTTG